MTPTSSAGESSGGGRLLPLAIVSLLAVGGGVAIWWLARSPLPRGPVAVAWDRDSCPFCRMHVGQPSFAVQLQTTAGEVLNFDDTGCYFRYVAARKVNVHAVYFHHHREDRWLPRRRCTFVEVDHSPMGFNLGATDAGAGTLTLAQARRRCLEPKATTGQAHLERHEKSRAGHHD